MDMKKQSSVFKPFRTPTIRPNRDNQGQHATPELHPHPRGRLPHRQSLGLSSRGPANETNTLGLGSQPVDDVPLDDFDRELLAQLESDGNEDMKAPPVENKRMEYHSQPPILTPIPRSRSKFNFENFSGDPSTPLRGQQSSSSDVGLPPSPSIGMVQQRNSAGGCQSKFWGSNNNSEPHSSLPTTQASPARPHFVSGSEIHQIGLSHAPPMIQGIRLVSAHDLPDRFRSVFPFPVFNAIQSKCFSSVYQGSDNVVLSAPTGSGKTVVMELAICCQVTNSENGQFKVVYQAPTKSLCSERFRDWQAKFSSLGLQCAELTGDTDYAQLRNVQSASIIITTPEKWDSMTRKWKDHSRLMQLVKLFLIDEVHILKEARGATLEAVVSRMKSAGSNVRFIALSATVPNSEDIATWLGKDPTNQHLPAHREKFGEEFRPVKLRKYVYGYQANGNDFAFDKVCESKLPEVISKHSSKKPIMIFCCTRNSAIATAKSLANMWSTTNPPNRHWNGPQKNIVVHNLDLKSTISSGVAFHHAGLDASDRRAVEQGFLEGHINIICCTSTLAVGVNLPCHLVIVKNTVTWQDNGCREYADLEMMQMLGRAGRPQFDDSAVAVILTRKERVDFYEKMVSGSECLESCLHLNLIDHLNAEIGLGTVSDITSATKWLAGTFFFVRLRRNPNYYKLKEGAGRRDEDEMLRQICEKDIALLQECNLVTTDGKLKSTEFGDAMARYYVKYETMKILVSLEPKAKISEILSAIAQADEFREIIRLKAGEKSLYKEINKGNGIRFPIKVDISLAAHKISLLIQSELGAVELPATEQYQKHKLAFQQDKGLVFSHINRLIRCVIDCQIYLEDAVAIRHALELARSFGARVWDNSPLQMKQIEQIGVVAVRKLANAGINTIELLEDTEAHRIDMILSKNPPFGTKLLTRLRDFPKLRVLVKFMGKETKPGKPVRVNLKADIGFINEKPPLYFRRTPIYVCFLAETSDGRMIDFRRISASKLQKGHDIFLSAELNSAYQYISCYVMCDDIAGTMRQAELKPNIPASLFPVARPEPNNNDSVRPAMNTSRRRSNDAGKHATPSKLSDEFSDDIFDDGDVLAAAENTGFIPIEDFDTNVQNPTATKKAAAARITNDNVDGKTGLDEPRKLDNGKWACNHICKNKTSCKHLCCREGTDKPPKSSKKPLPTPESTAVASSKTTPATSTTRKDKGMISVVPKSKTTGRARDVETLDLTDGSARLGDGFSRHSLVKPGNIQELSFFDEEFYKEDSPEKDPSSDYGASWMDDIPSPSELLSGLKQKDEAPSRRNDLAPKGSDLDDPLDFNVDVLPMDLPPLDHKEAKDNPGLSGSPKMRSLPCSNKQKPSISPPETDLSGTKPSLSSGLFVTSSSSPTILRHEPMENKKNWLKRPSSNLDSQAPTTYRRQKYNLGAEESTQPNINFPGTGADQEKDTHNRWEGIDPSLLEEFKDLVDFL